jgi:hypothetical protein
VYFPPFVLFVTFFSRRFSAQMIGGPSIRLRPQNRTIAVPKSASETPVLSSRGPSNFRIAPIATWATIKAAVTTSLGIGT